MAVTKQQKQEILAELVAKFKDAKSIGFASSNALTVAEFGDLRNELRTVSASYTLAKKTLIKKALKDAIGVDIELSILEGQIGVVCSNDDAIAGLSKVNDLVKKTKGEKITWAASIIEGELKEVEETKVIAGMPSRDTLLGRLVGSMKSPISGLARFFDAAAKELEEKGTDNLGKLESGAPAATEAPKTEEAPAKEEIKAEEVVIVDKKGEAKVEEEVVKETGDKEEVVVTAQEVDKKEAEGETIEEIVEEAKAEEAPKEEKKKEDAA